MSGEGTDGACLELAELLVGRAGARDSIAAEVAGAGSMAIAMVGGRKLVAGGGDVVAIATFEAARRLIHGRRM